MSNPLAIGAVTATLRRLIEKGIAGEATGIHVTTFPPDKARTFGQDDGDGRVNLFLYQTQFNAAWRNLDMPRQSRPGETGHPPLAIDLLYLVTAYEKTEETATPGQASASKPDAARDKELMGSFTSELDAMLDEDEDD